MDPLELLTELISIPGPAGQEGKVRQALMAHLEKLGFESTTDAKGNLLVPLSKNPPKVAVTAHMDEIAMIVRAVNPDGTLKVDSLGGLFAWKLGEGPVEILATGETIPGILSFGSIHTTDVRSTVRNAIANGLEWEMAKILTGRSEADLLDRGVRPGTRVVVAPSRRAPTRLGSLIAGYFLDDRADLVSWLLALEALKGKEMDVLFIATAAEEVGGEGALFALQNIRPDVCIALELGPDVADAPVDITDQPTVWVNDSYSAMAAADIEMVAQIGKRLGMRLQFQALSRGGSDASCAASHGLCGRPITFGLPMENSHGFEVMHPEAMVQLAKLTVETLRELLPVPLV